MNSRWIHLKDKAVGLRKHGNSIRDIEKRLGIPRSTLSGWLRNVPLKKSDATRLKRRWNDALISARKEAVKWHRAGKATRMANAKEAAEATLDTLDLTNPSIVELALAFLYLGEGSKTGSRTALGSSDPGIAKFFVIAMRKIYRLPRERIKCYLHLRADQNPEILKRYWSRALDLPTRNFGKPSFDQRTANRPTYSTYKGVCLIECGRVDIQRRLMYIANGFCEKIGTCRK